MRKLRECAVRQIAEQHGDTGQFQHFDPVQTGEATVAEAEALLEKLGPLGVHVVIPMLQNLGVTPPVARALVLQLAQESA